MPLKRCSNDGKSGWKYGDSGHCYTGPGAKKKAIKQGLAQQYNGGEKFQSSLDDLDIHDIADIYRDEDFSDNEFKIVSEVLGYTEKEMSYMIALRKLKKKKKDEDDDEETEY